MLHRRPLSRMAHASAPAAGQTTASPQPHAAVHKVHGRIAHSTHGRVRLQFRGQQPATLHQIEHRLRAMPRVQRVEVRPKTGSIIVHHSVKHTMILNDLADLARSSGLFLLEVEADTAEASAHLTDVEHDAAYLVDHSKSGKAIVRYSEHLNRVIKTATNGWVDLRVLLPATAGFCALLFVEVEAAPLWLPLALFSFQSFNNLHQPHPTVAREAREQMAEEGGVPPDAESPSIGKERVASPTAAPASRSRRVNKRSPSTPPLDANTT